MATKTFGGAMADGGLVNAIGQALTFVFAWGATAPTVTPVTLASTAGAYPGTSTAVAVGVTCKGTDGKAYGCAKAGTTAATTVTGPNLTNGPGASTGTFQLACGISVPCYVDGSVTWIQLSGPLIVQRVILSNRDASNILDLSSLATVAVGTGTPVPYAVGGWMLDGAEPETFYVIAASGLAYSVGVCV